jgi:hypothetical protein
MALRMAALLRKNGYWFSRKVIPADVRDEYARLFRVRREAHLKLPGDLPPAEAKIQHAEWKAEVETRIATLRAARTGEGRPLTRRNAIALAGRWYTWFIEQHEEDPGPPRVGGISGTTSSGTSSIPKRPIATLRTPRPILTGSGPKHRMFAKP